MSAILGKGKYSYVLKATHLPSGQKVSIKVLHLNKKKKLRRELAVLSYLKDGPNIEAFREPIKSALGGNYCIVTDHYLCDNFDDYFKLFTLGGLQSYMRDLLTTLDFIHSRGVIHRDIKPQNVLYSFKARKMRVIDFGLAEFYIPDRQLSVSVGNRFFKAPELLLDYAFYSYAVDIWAAGIIFASILFKRFPFFLA